jgi:hypothetical protein
VRRLTREGVPLLRRNGKQSNPTGLDNSVQRYLKYQKDDAQIQNADA